MTYNGLLNRASLSARDFLDRLTEALPEMWPPDAPRTWAEWSAYMVDRLHAVAAGAGMSCVCQHPHTSAPGQPEQTRELLFDFCWYTDTSGEYALPAVIIE